VKIFITIIMSLLTINTFAKQIDCTTKITKGRIGGSMKTTYCGHAGVNAVNNGIKYRRQAQFCGSIKVEFFSIKATDASKFTHYCDKIFTDSCYMIGIRDLASREGMANLSSYAVFSSIANIPTVFNISASGVGHNRKVIPKPGIAVYVDLSCRVKP